MAGLNYVTYVRHGMSRFANAADFSDEKLQSKLQPARGRYVVRTSGRRLLLD